MYHPGGNSSSDFAGASHASLTSTNWGWSEFGNCTVYDGSTSYGAVSIDLSNYSALTISLWLYWDAYANDDDLALEYTPNFNTNNGAFFLNPNSSAAGGGNAEVAIRGSAGGVCSCTFSRPTALEWHQYVIVLDLAVGSNEVSAVYIDGRSQSLTYQNNGNPTGTFANSVLYWMSRSGSSLFSAGRLTDLRLYNWAHSAGQAWGLFDPATRYALYEPLGRDSAFSLTQQDISPSLLTLTPTIYEPSVLAGVVVVPDLLTLTPTIYSPTVGVDAVTISPDGLTLTPIIYSPLISTGASVDRSLIKTQQTPFVGSKFRGN